MLTKNRNGAWAYWVQEPGRSKLVSMSLAKPAEHEVRIRTLYSAISLGTERLVFSGAVPESQYESMRAPFQDGEFPGPVKYGYSNVGRVEAGPKELIGRVVFCLYPHQDNYVVPQDAVVPVPETVPATRAVLAANMETAINGLWDVPPAVGSKVIVMGAGVLGCLMAYLVSKIPGVEVQLVDIDLAKASVAKAFGIQFAEPGLALGEADLVIHASGTSEGLATAFQLAGFEATILEMSWFGSHTVSLPLGESFHVKRLRLQSSQVGTLGATQRPRWDCRRRLILALDLLSDEMLDKLFSGQSDFENLPSTMEKLTLEPHGHLCHRIVYPGADVNASSGEGGE